MDTLIVKVVTLGCKVNQCESASIVSALIDRGHNASEGLEPADVYILNTCSVTAEADRKSRQYISKMRKLNEECHIIVVGCSTQKAPEKFDKPNVYAIGGTTNKIEFVAKYLDILCKNNHYSILSDRIVIEKNAGFECVTTEYYHENLPKSAKTRHFIKIQDGCNRFCSYCIIPYLRGRSRSREIPDIIDECEKVTSEEIVLTGIDISSYGKEKGGCLVDLIRAMTPIKARKRLSSFECEIIDDELLYALKEAKFCPHFHMSLQSGSDEVLKSMNRRYNTDFYYEKVRLIRKYFTNAGITTDVIVGFPTETDEYFEQTVSFVKKCGFSDIHVFPYSSREGTVASRKYSALDKKTVSSRVNRLLQEKAELHSAFITANLNSVAPVYAEDREKNYNVGYTPNYIKVYSDAPCGKISDVFLKSPYKDGILGTVINRG